jgi:hypothetical protein
MVTHPYGHAPSAKERLVAEIFSSDPAVFFSSAPADVLDYKLHSNADIPGLSCVVTLILDKQKRIRDPPPRKEGASPWKGRQSRNKERTSWATSFSGLRRFHGPARTVQPVQQPVIQVNPPTSCGLNYRREGFGRYPTPLLPFREAVVRHPALTRAQRIRVPNRKDVFDRPYVLSR